MSNVGIDRRLTSVVPRPAWPLPAPTPCVSCHRRNGGGSSRPTIDLGAREV